MTENFPLFAAAVEARFRALSNGELLTVNSPDIFDVYLAAFPEGTNPIFRVRTEHDCSLDKQFVRNLGRVVAVRDGAVTTVWDVQNLPYPYDVVAAKMSEHVRSLPITSVYRTKQRQYGAEKTVGLVADKPHTFFHFWGKVATRHYSATPDEACGTINTTVQVFQRGLDTLSLSALDTVLELIDGNALYRGAEFRKAVAEFRLMLAGYRTLNSDVARSLFAWQNFDSPFARFRNTAIGTLIVDLSEGMDLDKAVRVFESKVAPHNYKRTTALITPKMVEQAVETLQSLGLESALERRFAKLSDVSVNNVLFVDNSVRGAMKGGIAGLLADAVKPVAVKLDNVEPYGITEFMQYVVPNAMAIDLLVENGHLGNFVSLTAPVHADAGRLFKWDNGFAWSYDGEVADSMRQRVQSRGGRVDGVLRFTHQWNDVGRNASLMDLHVFMPGHPFTQNPTSDVTINDNYGGSSYSHRRRIGWNRRTDTETGGVQDVDYVREAPVGFIPVENITFPNLHRMPEGDYVMKVHNWQLRLPTNSGFKAEIEFGGQVFQYDHPQPLKHKEWVTLAVVTLRNGQFSIRHLHPTTTSSQKKWGVDTHALTPVSILMASPNHWDGRETGAKHWFFMLKGCKNPDPARGIYNEFLRGDLEPHRKVFEILGSKTKCQPTDDQLSGVGFTAARNDKVKAVVTAANGSRRAYELQF
ncbi:hypothetical protein [EBPR siphovirus 2]|nr:hypothetical protein [EBPR siphovirus 2]